MKYRLQHIGFPSKIDSQSAIQHPMASGSDPNVQADSTGAITVEKGRRAADVPNQEDIEAIHDFLVQNSDGENIRFASILNGSHSPRRVLIIFVGHLLNLVRPFTWVPSHICVPLKRAVPVC